MRKIFLVIAAFVLAFGPASASPESEAHVESLIKQLHQMDGGVESDFILDQVDMPRVSKFVLGQYGRGASEEDLSLFTSRLDAFLRNFLGSRSDELANAKIEILSSVDRNPTDSIVTTRVSSPVREPMIMRWRVLLREGEWRLVDVEVHGLWLAMEQRAQVVAVLDGHNKSIRDLYPEDLGN